MTSVFPIREISSYNRKWCIKARVTSKTDLRQYSRNGQPGQVFSADLLDAEGGEIRCSFFNAAANKFYDILEKGKVYTFSNGNVKVANKRYNGLNHNYEIAFAEESSDIKQQDDDTKISQMNWNIQSIRSLMNKEPPFNADLCGTIHKFEAATVIRTKKDNSEVTKRVVSLADSSGSSFDITVWGELAELPDSYFENAPAVAVKSCGIREWGNRTGSLSQKTNLVTDPEHPEIKKQADWWKSNSMSDLTNLTQEVRGGMGSGKTPWVSLAEIKLASADQTFLYNEKGDSKYFNCFVRLANIRTNDRDGKPNYPYYVACPKCNRKLDSSNTCIEHGCVPPSNRFMFTAAFSDKSDSCWLTCFEDSGKAVFNQNADQIKDQIESMAPEKFVQYIKGFSLQGLYRVTVRVKPDEYQGEKRPKYSAVRVEKAAASQVVDFMYDSFMQEATKIGDVPDFGRPMAMAQ